MDEALTLYPAWRQAVAQLDADGMLVPGKVIDKAWLDAAFGIQPPKSFDDVDKNRLRFVGQMSALRDDILTKRRLMLRAIDGTGYRIVPPQDQTDTALKDRGASIRREIRSLHCELAHVDHGALTAEQSKRNADALAQVGVLAGFVKEKIPRIT